MGMIADLAVAYDLMSAIAEYTHIIIPHTVNRKPAKKSMSPIDAISYARYPSLTIGKRLPQSSITKRADNIFFYYSSQTFKTTFSIFSFRSKIA